MTARLARTASGARHLRWGQEIFATIDAHLEQNPRLTEVQRAALTSERDAGRAILSSLEGAVTTYRGFLDTGFLAMRASLRVANFLADEEQRLADGTLRPVRTSVEKVLPGGVARIFSHEKLSRVLRAGHERTAKYARNAAVTIATISGQGGLPDMGALSTALDAAAERIEKLLEQLDEVIEPQRRPLELAVERGVLELREGLEQMDARLRAHFTRAFIEGLYPELSRGARAVAAEDDSDDDDTEEPLVVGPEGPDGPA